MPLCLLLATAHTAIAELPNDSLYQLQSQWLDQQARPQLLQDLAGKTQVVSMIYTDCLHTCPTIVAAMQAIEAQFSERELSQLGFVLVSLSPQRDTPQVLTDFAHKRKLNLQHWTLLTGAGDDVRSLAMLLKVKYKAMDNDEVFHSNLLSVLDAQGRLLFQVPGSMGNVDGVVEKLRQR